MNGGIVVGVSRKEGSKVANLHAYRFDGLGRRECSRLSVVEENPGDVALHDGIWWGEDWAALEQTEERGEHPGVSVVIMMAKVGISEKCDCGFLP